MGIEGEEWMGVGHDEARAGAGKTHRADDRADESSGYRASIEQTL